MVLYPQFQSEGRSMSRLKVSLSKFQQIFIQWLTISRKSIKKKKKNLYIDFGDRCVGLLDYKNFQNILYALIHLFWFLTNILPSHPFWTSWFLFFFFFFLTYITFLVMEFQESKNVICWNSWSFLKHRVLQFLFNIWPLKVPVYFGQYQTFKRANQASSNQGTDISRWTTY